MIDATFEAAARQRLAKYAARQIARIAKARHDQTGPYIAHGLWYIADGSCRVPFTSREDALGYRDAWLAA